MARVITVAVVDDDRMLRDGLRAWLGDVPDLRLVATAATVGELLADPGLSRPHGLDGTTAPPPTSSSSTSSCGTAPTPPTTSAGCCAPGAASS